MSIQYSAGTVIFCEGEYGNNFYIVQSGEVEILKVTPAYEVKFLVTLVAGDLFGEMSLLTGSPRTASAIAKTDVTLVSVSDENFKKILSTESSKILQKLLLILCQRNYETNMRITVLRIADEESRAIVYLSMLLIEKFGNTYEEKIINSTKGSSIKVDMEKISKMTNIPMTKVDNILHRISRFPFVKYYPENEEIIIMSILEFIRLSERRKQDSTLKIFEEI